MTITNIKYDKNSKKTLFLSFINDLKQKNNSD